MTSQNTKSHSPFSHSGWSIWHCLGWGDKQCQQNWSLQHKKLQIKLTHITADTENAQLLSLKHSKYSTDFVVTVKDRNGIKVITKEKVDDINSMLLHSYQISLRLNVKAKVSNFPDKTCEHECFMNAQRHMPWQHSASPVSTVISVNIYLQFTWPQVCQFH